MKLTGCLRWLGVLGWVWMLTGYDFSGSRAWAAAADSKGELRFQVQLIWGTNGEKPGDKNLKEVESRITDGLKAIFKWKNYFEVNQKNLVVARNATQRLKLSEKCEIEVQHLGNSLIVVRLVGEGKCVSKSKEPVSVGKLITIAGEAKNDTAWFVVLKTL